VGGVIPALDRCILSFSKTIYLFERVLLRISLGKKRRDKLCSEGRFQNFNDYLSPTFFMFVHLCKVIKLLRLGNPTLLKINVPRYNYKLYCPINKTDFLNSTIREEEIIEYFQPKEGDIVVDVGAHVGRYTLIASKLIGPTGKVLAIEANPTNLEMLNRNIKLNRTINVTSLNYAVYSTETKIKLYLPGEELGDTIYNTIMEDRAKKIEKFIEVNAKTLDSLLQSNDIRQVNWIKIDVEGAEFEVLKGSTNILSKSKDISLLIEIHNLRDDNNLYSAIIEFLNLYNFKIVFEKVHDSGERHLIVRKSV
jgi:FkbM family methyltransferase